MSPELAVKAIGAIHKLAIEMGRGTAAPRHEYDQAIAVLDKMKAAHPEWNKPR